MPHRSGLAEGTPAEDTSREGTRPWFHNSKDLWGGYGIGAFSVKGGPTFIEEDTGSKLPI